MILSVTLDPSIVSRVEMNNFQKGKVYFSEKIVKVPEGGGINVSKVIKSFNEEVLVTGFLGGINGDYIKKSLDNLRISNSFLEIKDETKSAISIVDYDNLETKIYGSQPRVSADNLNMFYDLFKDLLYRFQIISISGKIPKGCPKDTFRDLILLSKESNKITLYDGTSYDLDTFRNIKPSLLILDIEDVYRIFRIAIDSEEEIKLIAQGYVDDNSILVINYKFKTYYIFEKDKYYKLNLPIVNINNRENFKDGFLGGYSISLVREYTDEYKYVIATACSLSSISSYEGGYIDMGILKKIINSIDLSIKTY